MLEKKDIIDYVNAAIENGVCHEDYVIDRMIRQFRKQRVDAAFGRDDDYEKSYVFDSAFDTESVDGICSYDLLVKRLSKECNISERGAKNIVNARIVCGDVRVTGLGMLKNKKDNRAIEYVIKTVGDVMLKTRIFNSVWNNQQSHDGTVNREEFVVLLSMHPPFNKTSAIELVDDYIKNGTLEYTGNGRYKKTKRKNE